MIRGVRGAISVEANTVEAIREATRRLLTELVERNRIRLEDIASVFFTGTPDLDVEVPARGAREMGWTLIPMFCMREMEVQDGLPRCIRVLAHINTDKSQTEIIHVYLGEAARLRPDLVQGEENGCGDESSRDRGAEGTGS
jgi:chorismate mutase